MLQALVLERLEPSMVTLQSLLEIILPCLVWSEKVHEQSRALGTISWLLRLTCNFPELSHMAEFSMSGQLMGTLGLFCMNPNQEISMGALEALHDLFKILVLHRGERAGRVPFSLLRPCPELLVLGRRYETRDRGHPEGSAEAFPSEMVCQHTGSHNGVPPWFPAPGITGLLSKPLSALCH
nr:uncharacterized protein LOC115845977 isoform X3 [Globicephala melas]